jgi:hypothetical protein
MKTFKEYCEEQDLVEWPWSKKTVSAPVEKPIPHWQRNTGRRDLPYNPNWIHRISKEDYDALPYHQKQALHAGQYGQVPDFNVKARGL